jgi:hypothetical protein
MRPSDFLPRFIAIRLGVLTVILYALHAIAPEEGHRRERAEATPPAMLAVSCEPTKKIENHDSEADALLRDMLLHD